MESGIASAAVVGGGLSSSSIRKRMANFISFGVKKSILLPLLWVER